MILITVTGDHDRPEWLIRINGMFEGSTGSHEVSVRIVTMRDVVEAGLNEAASTGMAMGFERERGVCNACPRSVSCRLRVTD